MSDHSGFYKGEKKKLKKSQLERKASKQLQQSPWSLPKVEIIKKGKKEW